ncbi:15376_t:CDS:2 [Acaulospora colombiana]|uniref:15376_t:CDS:1 n=1 Tax=Acaulospora colombiana TaxID=27376 RepID=A0ACA9MJD6_9GLOM|nr:15376_t:CDS:2 [Acaulospora colombiana]
MSPIADISAQNEASVVPNGKHVEKPSSSFTPLLHRTPWVPPVAVTGEGVHLILEDGTRIIDAVGGAAVNCIGSGHPKVIQAVKDQLDKLLSNQPSEKLAARLISSSDGAFSQCVFVSGGSEAMEAAIKLAKQYFWEVDQPQRKYFIARHQSYHGNTLGALALSHHPFRRAPYEDILNHKAFHYVSPAYYKRYARAGESEEQYVARLVQELEDKFQELGPENVIGFAAEPVVGATQGVTYAPKGYFAAMSAVCRKYGALLILDEVMCGMGRMGTSMHAWQGPNSYTDGVSPDIQAVAKGLGGGYGSIGAILLNERVAGGLQQGSKYLQHGHTYQAHPLAMAASLAVQDVIEEENLLEKAGRVGTVLQQQLEQSLTGPNALSAPYIFDIRGGGCFWGIEFQFPEEVEEKWFSKQRFGGLVQAAAMENGAVIIGMSGGIDGKKGDFIILAPAYNISDEEITEVVTKVTKSIEDVLKRTVLS